VGRTKENLWGLRGKGNSQGMRETEGELRGLRHKEVGKRCWERRGLREWRRKAAKRAEGKRRGEWRGPGVGNEGLAKAEV
jgi:hypothetical protein